MRIAGTEKLQNHFHDFFAGELRAGQVVQHERSVFLIQFFPLADPCGVVQGEFEPPIGF